MKPDLTRSLRRGPSTFSPDGTRVATAHAFRQVVVWEEATGDELFILTTSETGMGAPAWSPDGSRLLTVASGVVRLWDAANGTRLGEVAALRDARSVIWGEGGIVAVLDSDEVICVDARWAEVARYLLPQPWELTDRPSPDGRRLAFIDPDDGMSIIDLRSGTLLARFDMEASPQVVAWHPGAQQVAVSVFQELPGQQGQTVTRVFDLQSQALFREVPGRVVLHSFSPDGGLLVVHDDDRARIVDLGTGEAVDLPGEGCNWEEALWHQSGCLMLPAEKPTVPVLAAFRDGDDAVVILDSSGTIRLQDRSGQPLGEFGVAGAEALLRLSPQGDRVALRCGEALQVWELTGRFVAGLVHDPYPYDAAWSPDGSHIISSGRDGSIRVWDATTGEVLHTLPGGQSYGRVKVAWSPGGAEVLAGPVGEAGGSIQLWDATCGTPVRSLAGAETTHELRWSSDGALILGSQADGNSGLRWDVSTGQPLPPLVVHDPDGGFEDGFDTPWLAIWNPTGTRLATAWDDCLIRLWTPDSPEPLHVLDGHLNPVTHLAWNAAGTRLLSVSDDAVRLWDVASLGEDS